MSKILYLPGCSFDKYEKETSLKVFDYLKTIYDKATYFHMCCGSISETFNFEDNLSIVDHNLLNKIEELDIDLIIIACPNCYNYYKNNSSDSSIKSKAISIYEVLDQNNFDFEDYKQQKINIHDPCPIRYESQLHDAIRSLLIKMNFSIEEITFSKKITRCCSNGAMLGYTDPIMKQKFLHQRQSEFSYEIITYCSDCQRTLQNSSHILNYIF